MMKKKRTYPWNKSRDDDSGAENEVYAGPEYYEKRSIPDIQEEENRRAMEGVYAGPPTPDMMYMCVYAGPGYFSGKNRPEPVKAPEAPASGGYCAECGTPIKDHFKFCPVCGAAIEREKG